MDVRAPSPGARQYKPAKECCSHSTVKDPPPHSPPLSPLHSHDAFLYQSGLRRVQGTKNRTRCVFTMFETLMLLFHVITCLHHVPPSRASITCLHHVHPSRASITCIHHVPPSRASITGLRPLTNARHTRCEPTAFDSLHFVSPSSTSTNWWLRPRGDTVWCPVMKKPHVATPDCKCGV